jgi:hypothetical protein
MKKFMTLVAALAVATFAVPAYAANTQVDQDTYKALNGQEYDRSDGWYQRANRNPVLMENAHPTYVGGPTYTEDFDYGDGLGVTCSDGTAGQNFSFEFASGANDACDDTCDELSPPAECVIGFDEGAADAEAMVTCAGTTSDTCLCVRYATADENCAQATTTGDVRLLTFGEGVKLYAATLGATTAATTLPDMDASSLDIGADQADDEGIELFAGVGDSSGRPFIVGDDPAFQFCATLAIADADGSDDYHVGFRGAAEAPNDVFDDYRDVATIGYTTDEGTTSAIVIETMVDAGAATSTDTTMSSSLLATKLCVLVSDGGVVTYTVDGGAPTTTAAYTFTDGLAVIPFVHLLQQDQITGEADLTLWEVKYQ